MVASHMKSPCYQANNYTKNPLAKTNLTIISIFSLALGVFVPCLAKDPLPSWHDTAPKKAITAFVEEVTRAGSPDFVPPAERITVFDNDGTLWAEQPMYFQAFFIFDRIKALAPQHPEWVEKEPIASVLKGFKTFIVSVLCRALLFSTKSPGNPLAAELSQLAARI